jgi:broad specificity phosphatase PhoE
MDEYSQMKTFFLVRHGFTDYNKNKKFLGVSDESLNEIGRIQADFTGKYLAQHNYSFDLTLSSPLKRSIETAEILKKFVSIEIKKEPLLIERNYGIFEGKTPDEVRALYPKIAADYEKNKPFVQLPQGESCYDIENRIKELMWIKILTQYPEVSKILIITHLNPVRAFLHLLQLASWDIYFQGFKNASLTILKTNLKSSEILLNDFSCYEDASCNISNQDLKETFKIL